jgi:hypothetical protein
MTIKNPLLAGLINFFIWGAGYLYINKKQSFGYGLILVAILEHLPLLTLGIGIIARYPYYLYLVGHLVLSTVLAYDSYSMAIELDPNYPFF